MNNFNIILGKNDFITTAKIYLAVKRKLSTDGKINLKKNCISFTSNHDYESVVEFIKRRGVNGKLIKLN